MSTQSGKKPVSERPAMPSIEALFNDDGIGENALKFPTHIRRELSDLGLEGRWLDANSVRENAGSHKRGWVVYSYDTCRPRKQAGDPNTFRFGESTDGTIRRGTMVLGVKPKAMAERHRALLKQRAQEMSPEFVQKRNLATIKQAGRESGINIDIREERD